jgi:hypothetical protein
MTVALRDSAGCVLKTWGVAVRWPPHLIRRPTLSVFSYCGNFYLVILFTSEKPEPIKLKEKGAAGSCPRELSNEFSA